MAFAANGDILVADANAFDGGGGIIRVNPATGARTTVSANAVGSGPSFVDPTALAVLGDGDILVAAAGSGTGQGTHGERRTRHQPRQRVTRQPRRGIGPLRHFDVPLLITPRRPSGDISRRWGNAE